MNTAIQYCKAGSSSYSRVMEFDSSHDLFHPWLLIAELKGFPFPLQSKPGRNKEMSPELIAVWLPGLLGPRIQRHHVGKPIGLQLQTLQGTLYHATSVVASIRSTK
jgi:hypothetical protein